MSNNIRVLTVDDDANICDLYGKYLKKEGWTVDVATNGEDAIRLTKENSPNIILLDVMMPGMDGFETLREIRKFSKVPVIMLTSRGEAMDKINGLELGADDYVVKPPEMMELIGRIKAILRRLQPNIDGDADLVIDNLSISMTNYIVKLDGQKIEMPPKEIELLHYLATHQDKVHTRDQLLDAVWGENYKGDSRTVDVHIKRIREKLGDDNKAWKIITVWSVGYRFQVN